MKFTAIAIGGFVAAATAVSVVGTPSADRAAPASAPITNQAETPATDIESNNPVRLADGMAALELGRKWLESVPDYTATFHRQERIHDTLRDLETTELKLRHSPFSVTMTWARDGRRVHYRDGVNQNRVAVRMGGWKRRLGWINLDPHASLAMQQSRYPITDVGLLRLTEQLIENYRPYLLAQGVRCAWLSDDQIDGRPCRVFHVEYDSAQVNPEYRQSTAWLDREWNIPLSVRNTDWQSDSANPDGLVEYYHYENIRLDVQLTDGDFSAGTPDSSDVAAAAE